MKKCIPLCIFFAFIAIVLAGCSSLKKPSLVLDKIIKAPSAYIETLKHPTEFPVEFLPEVLNIEEILLKNPLAEDEVVKVSLLGESKLSSTHFVQVRKGGEFQPHFHKKHDKTVYIKRGTGIALLNGMRYFVESGTVLQVPGNTRYKLINTGDSLIVALSVFTPPFDGNDITYIKEEYRDKQVSEAQKEKDKREKNELLAEQRKLEEAKDADKFEVDDGRDGAIKHEKLDGSSGNEGIVYKRDDEQGFAYDFDIDKAGGKNNKVVDENDDDGFFTDELDAMMGGSGGEFVHDKEDSMSGDRNEDNDTSAFEYLEGDAFDGTGSTIGNESADIESKIGKLNELRDSNLISEEEYQYRMTKMLE